MGELLFPIQMMALIPLRKHLDPSWFGTKIKFKRSQHVIPIGGFKNEILGRVGSQVL